MPRIISVKRGDDESEHPEAWQGIVIYVTQIVKPAEVLKS